MRSHCMRLLNAVAYSSVWLSLVKRFCFLVSKWYWLQASYQVYVCQQKTSLFLPSSRSHCQGIVDLNSVGKSGSSLRLFHNHFWLFTIFHNWLRQEWINCIQSPAPLNLILADGLSSCKVSYRGTDKSLAQPGRKQATAPKLLLLQATQKIFGRLSVQPGLRSSSDLCVG
jgi:hypothetical protein